MHSSDAQCFRSSNDFYLRDAPVREKRRLYSMLPISILARIDLSLSRKTAQSIPVQWNCSATCTLKRWTWIESGGALCSTRPERLVSGNLSLFCSTEIKESERHGHQAMKNTTECTSNFCDDGKAWAVCLYDLGCAESVPTHRFLISQQRLKY